MINQEHLKRLIHCVVLCVTAGSLFASTAYAQGGPEVIAPIKSDTSPELRSIRPEPRNPAAAIFRRVHPVRLNPNRQAPAAAALAVTLPDPVLQSLPGPTVDVTLGQGFDGVGDAFSGPQGSFVIEGAPPDTVGAVGETQFVQWVNSSFAIFDKATGKIVFGPVPGNTLWKGFKGACANSNDGDPIVQYDKVANRWVMAQFSVSDSSGFFQCVAVSTTSDATGKYKRFQFKYSDFDDYPKMGVWTDGYYISFNMFKGNSFLGSKVCVYDRDAMLGKTKRKVTQQCFQLGPAVFGLLPSDLDGATPPPAGSPNYFVALNNNSLDLWKFHVDWANSASSTLGTGSDHAPNTNIKVGAFKDACGGVDCVQQSEVNGMLDSLGERLMYRLAYRNFTDHEALVVNHSVDAKGLAAVRWYELRNPNGTPAVFQQGTFAPDSNHRWMGSIAMDKAGNIAVGYSISSTSIHPGIRLAGRAPTDPLNKLGAELKIIDGGGSQTGVTRWGDYSALTVDPVDDCKMWFTTEFLKATGGFNWNTRVASFKFNSCH
jgi:hypothetical protein